MALEANIFERNSSTNSQMIATSSVRMSSFCEWGLLFAWLLLGQYL